MCVIALNISRASEPTASERLDLIPLPADVIVERNVDISEDPAFEFSKKHLDFADLDPFQLQRLKNAVPENYSLRFTTPLSPDNLLAFYKLFFDTESQKRKTERTLPYYTNRSYQSNKGYGGERIKKESEFGNASYYKIHASDGHGKHAFIVIFNEGKGGSTTVFIITYTRQS